ncbi:MAG: sulfotransferase family 2 domain-containing protein [Pseudomonadota bacterium]
MVIRVDAHKIAYMAVPKAACSSVKAAMGALDPTNDISDPSAFAQKQVHGMYPTQRFRMHRWERVEDFFRFTVVRDPLKRLFGVYTNRVVAKKELFGNRKIKRGRVDLPPDPDPDFFFQNLSPYIAIASVIKHHALPTVCFTGKAFDRYTGVYRTSDLSNLATDLSDQVGREVVIPHFNSSDMTLTLDDLKPETHQALAARLEEEYAHLADFFDNPFARRMHPLAA